MVIQPKVLNMAEKSDPATVLAGVPGAMRADKMQPHGHGQEESMEETEKSDPATMLARIPRVRKAEMWSERPCHKCGARRSYCRFPRTRRKRVRKVRGTVYGREPPADINEVSVKVAIARDPASAGAQNCGKTRLLGRGIRP